MNKPKKYILKDYHISRNLVDVSTDEKKAVIYKTPNRGTSFDEVAKQTTISFFNVIIVEQNEQVCSLLFETKNWKILL